MQLSNKLVDRGKMIMGEIPVTYEEAATYCERTRKR
jgi:hypothetical protein